MKYVNMSMDKKQFPIFKNNTDLIYCDNAATTQCPQQVFDAIMGYYTEYKANTGRGIYQIAEQTTQAVQDVRELVKTAINAQKVSEIVFTAGTTAGINYIVNSWGQQHIKAGDEIVVTQLEHHANFVPWQQLCKQKSAAFKVIPVDKQGNVVKEAVNKIITTKTKLVAITHVSNVLGTNNEQLENLIAAAHEVGAKIVIDGAQAAKDHVVDVQKLGCDFYVFSGHKVYGPTGVGVLYIKAATQKEFTPATFGGGAVYSVTDQATQLADAPACYEPGTLPIAQIIGLGQALNYRESVGVKKLFEHSNNLVKQLLTGLQKYPQITILGDTDRIKKEATLISFVIKNIHAHDVAAFFDTQKICVRAGHHCAQPLAKALGYDASVRVSFAAYNNAQEVDHVLRCLEKLFRLEL